MESTCETGPGVVTPLAAELVIAVLKLAPYSGPMELGSLAGRVACTALIFFKLSRFLVLPPSGRGLAGVFESYLLNTLALIVGDLFVICLRKIELRLFIYGSFFVARLASVLRLVVEPPPTLMFMIFD